jgi:DNA polymerase I
MVTKLLDEFFKNLEEKKIEVKNKTVNLIKKKSVDPVKTIYKKVPKELPPSYLVSATYDGKKRLACLKLYEPISQRIYFWYDTTGHKPYLLTNITPEELTKIENVVNHHGLDHFEIIEKYDALSNQKIKITKVVTKDPLSIGGYSMYTLRDIIPKEYPEIFGFKKKVKVWEAKIKYYQCYLYDRNLSPGMIYKIENGEIIPTIDKKIEKTVEKILKTQFKSEPKNLLQNLKSWTRLLEYPAPSMRRAALDIEVYSPVSTRVPDPEKANYPVTCASFLGSDGIKRVLLLKRKTVEKGDLKLPSDIMIELYNSEKELLFSIFKFLENYPFIITFNGDNFDLRYLYNRAERLDFKKEDIPIELNQRVSLLKYGVHIDLYRFFFNRSIRIYAISQKYSNVSLDSVSKAILGKPKLELSKPISELSLTELAKYCINDAEITLNLTTYDEELIMKLIIALTRLSRMPIEDMSRQGVSRWIRSFMQYEHRRRGILIPNKEDIILAKGKTATKATIKGKKYKGAIVVQPVPGVHFNVAVMDFQSLYPSIIKVFNLGYQSVRCNHEDCKENKVPGTPHWICKLNRSLESVLIGSLRDLRVKWYKLKVKDLTLPKEKRNWYNVIQNAIKVILNASYGVFGAETFDLYCPPVAEVTAAYGRSVITQTINKAQESGIEVIYGDTDSLFLKNPSREQIENISKWSEKKLGMELEVDKSYRYAVLSSRKKNYLGIFPDGTVDVKGLTGKKRHIPRLIKNSFYEMQKRLSQVNSPIEFEAAKKDVSQIVFQCYKKIKKRRWENIDDLAFDVVLGKAPEAYQTKPQHVKAALILKKQGVDLKAGDRIRFIKIGKKPNVKPVQLTTDREVGP